MFMRYTGNGIGHKNDGFVHQPLPVSDMHDISTDTVDSTEQYIDKTGNESESESTSESGSEDGDDPREDNQDVGDDEYEINESSL